MARRPILLTGVNGQVGGELLPLLRSIGNVLAPTRQELNLIDPEAICRYVREKRPGWIVNPAAYTAVDKAEKEPKVAFAINSIAPAVLGQVAAAMGVPVLHFSTDYVFSGDGTVPWRENDPTGPINVYGQSKLKGERGLADSGAAHIIFRTSWVYGTTGNNFLRTILRLARKREEMKIVADQHGAPTWSRDLARLTVYTIRKVEELAERDGITIENAAQTLGGIYHACCTGATTWYRFAEAFLQIAQKQESEQRFARLERITSAEYPTAAKRPFNSRMNCERLAVKLGFKMPTWEESTAAVMAEMGRQIRL